MKDSLCFLNVEDNENDAQLNQAMISARWPHCRLVRVERRPDFMAALEQGGYDLILSDYTMPGFNGLEALALAREKRPEIPFVFVSGTIGEDTAIEALKNGATDYVLKHRLLRLIPAVDRALREAEERAECLRAEEAMRQSEHKYRELFECLGDPAFLADEQTGKIIDVNHCAETTLGCSRADILGRKETRFLVLDPSRPRAGIFRTDAEPTTTFRCELIRVNGETIPAEVRTTRLTLYGQTLVLRLAHDVSHHSQAISPAKPQSPPVAASPENPSPTIQAAKPDHARLEAGYQATTAVWEEIRRRRETPFCFHERKKSGFGKWIEY